MHHVMELTLFPLTFLLKYKTKHPSQCCLFEIAEVLLNVYVYAGRIFIVPIIQFKANFDALTDSFINTYIIIDNKAINILISLFIPCFHIIIIIIIIQFFIIYVLSQQL
jgi:hypothetical protein